jgi:hypothetical protein
MNHEIVSIQPYKRLFYSVQCSCGWYGGTWAKDAMTGIKATWEQHRPGEQVTFK